MEAQASFGAIIWPGVMDDDVPAVQKKTSPQYDDVFNLYIKHPCQVRQVLDAGEFPSRDPLVDDPRGSETENGRDFLKSDLRCGDEIPDFATGQLFV